MSSPLLNPLSLLPVTTTLKASTLKVQRNAQLLKQQRLAAARTQQVPGEGNPVQIPLDTTGVREGPARDPGPNGPPFVAKQPWNGVPVTTGDFVNLELEEDGEDNDVALQNAQRNSGNLLHESRVEERNETHLSTVKYRKSQNAFKQVIGEAYDPRTGDRKKRREGKLASSQTHSDTNSSTFTPAPTPSLRNSGSTKKTTAVTLSGPQGHLDGGIDTTRLAIDAFTAPAKIAIAGGGASGTKRDRRTITAKKAEGPGATSKAQDIAEGQATLETAGTQAAQLPNFNPMPRHVPIPDSRGRSAVYEAVEDEKPGTDPKHGEDALVLEFDESTGFAYQA